MSTVSNPWQMKASSGGGQGDYVACPAGNYPGTIVGVVDVGLQPTEYGGERKDVRQVVVLVELARKRPDGKPFVIAIRNTWSFDKKSNFRALVEGVTGHQFKDGEDFDPQGLVPLPVMAMVTNTTKGEGDSARTYHNIQTLSKFPEEFPVPKPVHGPFVWSVRSGEPFPTSGVEWLPYVYGTSLADLVATSREARSRGGGRTLADEVVDDVLDSIPY